MSDNRNNLGKILKQRRAMIPLTLSELAAKSGVSSSHLGRIERGEHSPSSTVLLKIAKPLGFEENELLALGGCLNPQPSAKVDSLSSGQLDPYVASVLSREPVDVQRAVVRTLKFLKSIARGMANFEVRPRSEYTSGAGKTANNKKRIPRGRRHQRIL